MTSGTPGIAFKGTGAAAGRDVATALAIKLGLLAVLYCAFFAEDHRPKADPRATAAALLDRPAVSP